MGMGHIVRCTALAHMMFKAFNIRFYIFNPEEDVEKIVLQNGFSLVKIDNEREFIDSLTGNEMIIIDGYQFDTDYQLSIKEKGCILICIDDLHDQLFISDLVLNHSPGVSVDEYLLGEGTRLLLGPKYALLRPAFIAQALKERELKEIDHLVICFGGADPKNLTQGTFQIVSKYLAFRKITIITGAAYKYHRDLKDLSSHNSRIQYYNALTESEMIECFLEANLAIVPASGILFEAIACKLPVISGFYIQNQYYNYSGFKSRNTFYDAIDFSPSNLSNAVRLALSADHTAMILNQGNCIDGHSAARLRNEFRQLSESSRLND